MGQFSKIMMRHQRGQAVVEYLLLIVAIVSIMFATFKTLQSRLVADPDQCKKGSINPLCFLESAGIDGSDTVDSYKFRTFRLK